MAFGIDDVLSGIINGIAGNSAANAQQQSAQQAMDLQRQMYGQSRADQAPWMQAGQQALGSLLQQLNSGGFNTNLNPQDVASDPGYQFRMQQAQQALSRSAAAGGRLNSGGFMKGLDRYSQGLASDEYGQAFARQQSEHQNAFSRLYGLAGMGQAAASGMAQQGGNYANSMSNLYGAQGNAQAAGDMAWANGINQGIQGLGSNVNRGFGMMSGMGMGGARGSLGSLGGYGGGGYAPSASSAYAGNPGNYSLGNFNLRIPGQDGGY